MPTTAEHAHCMDHRCNNSQQLAIPLRQASGESQRGSASIPEKRSWTSKDFEAVFRVALVSSSAARHLFDAIVLRSDHDPS
jgi:hypothetical protein